MLRERTRLERAIDSYRRIEREVDEAIELIELGEAEAHGDLARLDKLSCERQALLSELSSAAGLGVLIIVVFRI